MDQKLWRGQDNVSIHTYGQRLYRSTSVFQQVSKRGHQGQDSRSALGMDGLQDHHQRAW